MVDVNRVRARAKVTFGLSVLAAAAAVGWFWYQGTAATGLVLAVLFVVGGYWEYRRRLADARRAAQAESNVDERDRR
ncbi:MAG: hypothetical protein A07HR67_00789 [uncultured archaeon A07HR67]|jgi:hypothetical protein|nr:MAG: hypothetical protein A07HR67_00789 [uncultured archaeon A07HR67]